MIRHGQHLHTLTSQIPFRRFATDYFGDFRITGRNQTKAVVPAKLTDIVEIREFYHIIAQSLRTLALTVLLLQIGNGDAQLPQV